jgi:hypothetical protein
MPEEHPAEKEQTILAIKGKHLKKLKVSFRCSTKTAESYSPPFFVIPFGPYFVRTYKPISVPLFKDCECPYKTEPPAHLNRTTFFCLPAFRLGQSARGSVHDENV